MSPLLTTTGCGKTVISAFDYARFCKENPGKKNRLLFVAHREEILEQSIETFRGVLHDFGDLWVGSHKPEALDYLFVSIQTMNSTKLYRDLPADYYDFIVVDEFHHAAAAIYQEPLHTFSPKVLLGLTATPERMDGEDILAYFDHRIAAEIRLPEAIDRKLQCPFQYFSVSDTVDLQDVRWTRGGYDRHVLSNIYSLSGAVAEKRARHVIANVEKYTTSVDEIKALGFCVSKEHAKFMADSFNQSGIPALELDSNSGKEDRATAKKRLEAGEIKAIFVVDLYNEGVDITSVNTVLFLRPTESLTIFLQQLGRGLRLDESKDCLTVLDFIGQANKKYNYEEKFAALLSNTKHSVEQELKKGFVSVPKGCYISLEKKASEYVLQNIRSSIETRNGIISKLASFEEDTGKKLTLSNFLSCYRMDPRAIYKKDNFSRFCICAGVKADFAHPEPAYRNFHAPSQSKVLCGEMLELMQYRYDHIDILDKVLDFGFACPIDLHCTYSRDQLLVALDFMKPSTVREGVKWLPEKKLDVLFVTLNKSDKDYSPTTMYEDYSINKTLFHWQSQSTTGDHSATGQRYIHHREQGSRILLCVRDAKKDAWGGTASYCVFGFVDYMQHTGSNPMSIIWRLEDEIPAKYLRQTSKLIVS